MANFKQRYSSNQAKPSSYGSRQNFTSNKGTLSSSKSSYRESPNFTPRSLRRIEHKARNRIIITIVGTITLLVFLITWGLPALINGLSVFNKLKTKESNISPTGQNAAIGPPTLNIPFDATNSASIKINGYSTPNAKVEIYFDDTVKDIVPVQSDGTFTSNDLDLSLGTNNIYGKTIDGTGGKSLPSKTIQLTFNNQKPDLEVSSPTDGSQINGGDKKLTVSGKTDSANVITVNGQTVVINFDGSFSKAIGLSDGDNTIAVVSTDPIGNTTKIERKVTYTSDPSPSPNP